ncbi:hypothetical protein L6164_001199 [Bauhinia variegata]|uniref:Uncharacterized protein n=1 Tax=Bauhinia variegata TaxID=167791 RepID=A0ACB9Q856_BAUVA|nr:hypothetical protein L6164_001199 [Bauhinia variegata]
MFKRINIIELEENMEDDKVNKKNSNRSSKVASFSKISSPSPIARNAQRESCELGLGVCIFKHFSSSVLKASLRRHHGKTKLPVSKKPKLGGSSQSANPKPPLRSQPDHPLLDFSSLVRTDNYGKLKKPFCG